MEKSGVIHAGIIVCAPITEIHSISEQRCVVSLGPLARVSIPLEHAQIGLVICAEVDPVPIPKEGGWFLRCKEHGIAWVGIPEDMGGEQSTASSKLVRTSSQ